MLNLYFLCCISQELIKDKSSITEIQKDTRQEYLPSPIISNVYTEQPIQEIKEQLNGQNTGMMVEDELTQML